MPRGILTYSATPDVVICRRTALGIRVEVPSSTAAWRRYLLREALLVDLLIGGGLGAVGALLHHFRLSAIAAVIIWLYFFLLDWKRWRRQQKRGPSVLLYEAGVLRVCNLRCGPASEWPAAETPRLRVGRLPFSDLAAVVCNNGPVFTWMTAAARRAEVVDAVAELNAAIDKDRQ